MDIKMSFATKPLLPLPINKVMCMFNSIWFQVPHFEIYLRGACTSIWQHHCKSLANRRNWAIKLGGPKQFCSLWSEVGLYWGIVKKDDTPKMVHFAPFLAPLCSLLEGEGPPGPFLCCTYDQAVRLLKWRLQIDVLSPLIHKVELGCISFQPMDGFSLGCEIPLIELWLV